MTEPRSKTEPLALLALTCAALLWSVVSPYDLFTWFLEVVPVLIGAPILIFT